MLCWLAALPAAAPAPVPDRMTAPEGLRRQEERTRVQEQLLQPGPVRQPSPGSALAPGGLPEESPCFPVRDILLSGKDAARFGWLQMQAALFEGRCIGVAGLRHIVSYLDAQLVALGYVTSRVSLPPQNLADGRLELALHIGRIAQLRLAQGSEPDQVEQSGWGAWSNAFPGFPALAAGDILNVQDLEQGVEQMKRLPSQMATIDIEPGPEPDTSVVILHRQGGTLAQRLRGAVSLDNAGNAQLGRAQAAANFAFDNPLGLNDLLALSGNSNFHTGSSHRSQGVALDYSLPWGYSLFNFSAGSNRYAQTVQGTTARFVSSGTSEGAGVKWTALMVRTASARFGLHASLSTRRAASFLDDVEVLVQRQRTTRLQGGIAWQKLIGAGTLDLDLSYSKGMPWLSAQEDFALAQGGGLTNRARIWSANLAFRQPFALAGRSFLYQLVLHGQATGDVTLPADQIAIGNRYSVRGFDGDSVLLAESGYFLRNELATALMLAEGCDAQLYFGLDAGRVWGAGATLLVGSKLAGAVFGVRGRWGPWQADVALGTPLYQPEGFRTRRWNPYLMASYAF